MASFWKRRSKKVLVDIDTQIDLVNHYNGLQPDTLLRHLRRIIAWARINKILVISTSLAIPPDISANTANSFPAICTEGTPGQNKLGYTLLPSHIFFEANSSTDLPENLSNHYQQIIFEKRGVDTFLQPRADRLLTGYTADEFIVFGTGIETAIHKTVLGLLSRGKNVTVVTDAINGETMMGCQLSLRKMAAKGALLKETAEITGESRLNGTAQYYAKKLTV